MSAKNKKSGKNRAKQDALSVLKEIGGYVVTTYLIVMTVIFPLYTRKQFIYTSSHQLSTYRFLSFLFVGITLIIGLAFLFFLIRNKNLKQTLTNAIKQLQLPDWAVLAYGLCNLISYIVSPYRAQAFLGFEGWQMGLLTQLLMIFGYFLVRCLHKSEPLVWYGMALALVLQAMLVILNRTGNDPLGFYKGLDWFDWKRRNLLGTIGNINWLCGYMICVLPVLIMLYVTAKKLSAHIIVGIGLYFTFGALFLQGSESGIATLILLLLILPFFLSDTLKNLLRYLEILFMISAFWSLMSIFNVDLIEPEGINTPKTVYSYLWLIPTFVLLGLILFLYLRFFNSKTRNSATNSQSGKAKNFNKSQKNSGTGQSDIYGKDCPLPKPVGIIIKIVPVLILLGGVIVFIVCQFSDSFWQLLGSKSILRLSYEWGSMRGAVWSETFKNFFRSNPLHLLFGYGPDTFGYWFLNSGITIHTTGMFENSVYTNAHNEFLTVLVNNGSVGFLSYAALFVLFIRHFAKNIKDNPVFLTGLLCIIAYTVNQFVSFQQIFATPLFFLILGMCMCKKSS